MGEKTRGMKDGMTLADRVKHEEGVAARDEKGRKDSRKRLT